MIIRITLDAIMIKVHNDIIVIITFSILLSLKKLRHINTRIRFRMLAVLFVMFIGVLINIYRESFPLFRYGVVMVTVLYLALSFSHPDYIIARVNIANAPGGDFSYLSDLSADAAPVIIPYMESLGYDFGAYELENPTDIMSEDTQAQWWGSYQPKGFGYYYLNHNKKRLDQTSLRTFNISRYMARKQIEARIDGK
jgi:hypothetical protein